MTNVSNTAVTWSITPAVGTISTAGLYTAPVSFTPQTITVKVTSAADTTRSATATATLLPVAVTLAPPSVSLHAAQTQQFSATVAYSSNTAVSWSIRPAGAGTITPSGLYTAPATVAAQQTVTVTATSMADATKSVAATVALIPAVAVHAAPSALTLHAGETQQFTATVDNSTNQAVSWSIGPAVGSMAASGLYTAPLSIAAAQTVTVTATAAADSAKTATASISLVPAASSTNLAAGKTATQSSSIAPASRAVDGNTDGNYWDGSVTQTGADANAWWQVDLGASYTITGIQLWNRTDCCGDRLSDYWVFVSDTPFAASDTPTTLQIRAATWGSHQTAPQPSTTLSPMSPGPYVRVQLSGTNNLQLAEVQVSGTGGGVTVAPSSATLAPGGAQQFTASVTSAPGTPVTWSLTPNIGSINANGLYTAPASVGAAQSIVVTATSTTDSSKSGGATVALQLSGTPVNLALGKTAAQSSVSGVGAAAAVDGNTDGNYWNGSVSQTAPDVNAWWQVDLGASATIGSVTIWNRTDCCGTRLNDYWIFVSDTPFTASDTLAGLQTRAATWRSHQTTTPSPSLTVPVGARGRYVRIQLSGTNNLHMAEVQVTGVWPADNIAIGKAASQSSSWAPASRAVDGNTDGNYWDSSVTQTGADANAWWQVDLGASAGIGAVAVWNRTDCCGDRLNDYWVFVSDTPFTALDTPTTLQSRAGTWGSHQTTAPNPATLIPAGVQGRYARVQLSGTNNLHMAEVEVYGAFR